MGTTATALHIMSSEDLAGAVASAYEAHDIDLVPIGSQEASSRVVAVRPGPEWLSVFDESNGVPDIAALAEIAVALTGTTDSVAVLTSVLDSDSFQLVLFARGEQVDVVTSEPADGSARLVQLSTSERTQTWGALFPTATPEALERADRVDSPFAEDRLAAWCAAVGLNPVRTTETLADAASVPGATIRAAIAAPAAAGKGTSTRLSFYPSPDDAPYLRLFPAAWPVSPGASQAFTWLVLSADGGFDDLGCTVETDLPGGAEISAISLTAHSFYNGQITSMTPLASFEADVTGGRPPTVRATPFAVPDVDPNSRKQIIILVRLVITVFSDGPVTIRPELRPDGSPSPLTLPPLRLRSRGPTWFPLGSDTSPDDPLTSTRADAVLGLNEPSIRSFVAIHRDLDQVFRDRLRGWCADWLDSLVVGEEATVTVHTQKHMTASFRVTKNTRTLPAASCTDHKLWPRLFRADDGYQTVRLSLEAPGYAFPIGGLTIQESLKNEPAMTPTFVDAISSLLGAGEPPPPPDEIEQPTLTVAAWVIDHPDIDQLLGTSPASSARSAETWCEATGPIQAWTTSSRWIPEFDLYDEYRETLYEEACAPDWFRSGARGALGTVGWTTRRLRFVGPQMWLGSDLAGRIGFDAVERVARVNRSADTIALSLRPERTLSDLEQALAPILPRA